MRYWLLDRSLLGGQLGASLLSREARERGQDRILAGRIDFVNRKA